MTADGVTIVKVNARSFSKVACIYYNKRSMSVNHFLLPNFERSPVEVTISSDDLSYFLLL